MTTAIKRRRGTTTQHSTFTGLEGEITVDSTKDTVVVHDGSTAGGFALLREDLSNNTNVITATNTKTLTNKTVDLASNTLTGTTAQFNAALSDNDFATLAGTETLSNKTFSTNPTISSGTANGVAYLNGSKVLTTGSALTFDGTNLGIGTASTASKLHINSTGSTATALTVGNINNGSVFGVAASGLMVQGAYAGPADMAFGYFSAGISTTFTEQMRLTSTGLGIGTSSPASKLHVSGGDIQLSAGNSLKYSSTAYITPENNVSGAEISTPGIITFKAGSGPTERMRLDSSGNLGLGVTPSAWTNSFGVIQGLGGWSISHNGANSNSVDFLSNAYRSGGANTYLYVANSNATRYQQVAGSHAWYTAPSGTAGNAISFTQAMTLDASGNLGIGTSSPAYKLDVNGAAVIRGNAFSTGAFIPAANVSAPTADASMYRAADNTLAFATASTERLRLDSSGNLLVGTTSANGKLYVESSSTTVIPLRAYVNVATSLSSPALRLDKYDNNQTTSQVFAVFSANQNAAGCGQINANGANQAAFGSFSDARLKTNIVDLPPQLENICALRPVEFDYIESEGGGHQISFIAQELEEVYPDAVGEREDGMKTISGWSKTEARLVKAIQEQQELINQLTARVAQLEGK